jgi:hypothetical protein
MAVALVEEVAVDPGGRRLRRELLLHLRHACAAADHGSAGERRAERIETVRTPGARGGDDVEGDRAVGRELDALLVGHPRHQLDAGCSRRHGRQPSGPVGRRRESAREQHERDEATHHEPGRE